MAESKEMSDVNERLYVDSYFRLLKTKENLPEAACVLRGLIQQINTHCAHLNLSDESSKKLKIELLTEYHEIMDRENPSGLLTIIPDNKSDSKTKASEQISESITKDALEKLNSYLDNLDINLPSSKKFFTVNKPEIKTANYNEQRLNNSRPQKYNFTTMPDKCSANEANNNEQKLNNSRPQKYNFTSMPNKRPANETEDSNPSYPSKRSFNRTYNKPKPTTSSSAPKPQTSGFVSASSMYRNPLKKAVEEEAKQAQNTSPSSSNDSEQHVDESLKHFDKKIVDVIFNEIMDFSPNIKWTDIAGLEFVKTTVQEIVIWPLLRPDIFTGLRAPPRGILLFGPPGTGKTLIGKCIATESNSTFFCISASSLASKWVGESEQLVRALFSVARINQPAVIFIDEIDSLLSQRSDKDQDFTRKLKTEFLVQFDGAKTQSEERILVVGATNRPHELDEAARRRFVKRLYVPLPDPPARRQIVEKLLCAHQHNLSESDLDRICDETKGYSGSDVAHLCKEAAMGPIRSIGPANIKTVSLDQVRAIQLIDFLDALRQVRASVAQDDLNYYLDWNKKFGSFGVETG